MWTYSSCQVQGRGHIKNQIPCQDKTKTVFDKGTYVIALADGAGSARLAHYGATTVVDSITQLFVDSFEELYNEDDGRRVKLTIMEKLTDDLNNQTHLLACMLKDLASTMLVVAINNDRFIIAHIGDGVIGYLDGDHLKVASAPANGEHANETYFVTSREAISTMKIFKGEINNIAGFVIMSDGTEQSLYNKRENALSPAIIKLMRRNVLLDNCSMRSQLEVTFQNVIATRTHDDCSIALITREGSVLHPFADYGFAEKCDLYAKKQNGISAHKCVARYDAILTILQEPTTCAVLARKIHLRPKYTKRHLAYLCNLGLIKCRDGKFMTSIRASRRK